MAITLLNQESLWSERHVLFLHVPTPSRAAVEPVIS